MEFALNTAKFMYTVRMLVQYYLFLERFLMTPNFSAISLKFGSSVGPLHVASAMSVDGMNANQTHISSLNFCSSELLLNAASMSTHPTNE
jgi:hypothetical protein